MPIFHTTVQSLDKTDGLKSWITGENLNGANKVILYGNKTQLMRINLIGYTQEPY